MTKEHWGKSGAGVLFRAKDTGRYLFMHRSEDVTEPGTWATAGGKIEPGETPEQAAKREAAEETGYSGPLTLEPSHIYKDGDFTFYNFVGHIPAEFEPHHSWESQGHVWASLEDAPHPLHYGLQELIQYIGESKYWTGPSFESICDVPVKELINRLEHGQIIDPKGLLTQSVRNDIVESAWIKSVSSKKHSQLSTNRNIESYRRGLLHESKLQKSEVKSKPRLSLSASPSQLQHIPSKTRDKFLSWLDGQSSSNIEPISEIYSVNEKYAVLCRVRVDDSNWRLIFSCWQYRGFSALVTSFEQIMNKDEDTYDQVVSRFESSLREDFDYEFTNWIGKKKQMSKTPIEVAEALLSDGFYGQPLAEGESERMACLLEAVDPDDAIVHYPVTIGGEHETKEGVPYHITLRWGKWKGTKEELVEAVEKALEGLDTHRPKISTWRPDVFKGKDKTFHVLLVPVEGHMLKLRDALEPVFGKDPFPEYKPHISVDEELWNEIQKKKLSPGDLMVDVLPLEVRMGNAQLEVLGEAIYKGRKVRLNKPMKGDVKKYKVYVKDPDTGNVRKINFGDPNMKIKRDDPKRRKAFRARHGCDKAKDKTTAKYWSCRLWSKKPVSKILKGEQIEVRKPLVEDMQEWNTGEWVHYSQFPEMKINPRQGHQDPSGIYIFPVSFKPEGAWHKYKYKFKVKADVSSTLDMAHLTKEEAISLYKSMVPEKFHEVGVKEIEKASNPVDSMWEMMKNYFVLSQEAPGRGAWNKAFRDQGFDSIFDDTGSIFTNEVQLLVLDPRKVKVIERLEQAETGFEEVKEITDKLAEILKPYGEVTVTQPKKQKPRWGGSSEIESRVEVKSGEKYLWWSVSTHRFQKSDAVPQDISVRLTGGAYELRMNRSIGASFDWKKKPWDYSELESEVKSAAEAEFGTQKESSDKKYDASVRGAFDMLTKQKAFIPEDVKPRQDDLEDAWLVFLLKTGDDLESEENPDSDYMRKLMDQWDSSVKKAKVQSVSVEDSLNWDIVDHGRRPKAEQQNNPIIVGKSGNEFHVLDGAHRILSASERGEEKIKALIINLDWADLGLFESVFGEQKAWIPEAKQVKLRFELDQYGPEDEMASDRSNTRVVAFDKDKFVGYATFIVKRKKAMPMWVEVEKKYQGKGVANSIYDFLERKLGVTVIPGDAQSDAAKGIWKKRSNNNVGEQKAWIPEVFEMDPPHDGMYEDDRNRDNES
jgi:8-oxo-dGTP pyrophosphatase MutT (NUDIX family)